ncbi:MAG: hypothetical protein IPO58_03505 [Betaproteobacteria bacterium]|nr:hypothetical protein [Betaproteobacteria bacterium]
MIALRIPAALARVLAALMLLCALAVFAWVAAYWIWRAAEPAAVPAAVREDTDWSGRILSGSALGFVRTEAAAAAAPQAVAAAAIEGRIRLLGIAREAGGKRKSGGQALFRVDGRRVLWLRVGEDLDPGITLAAVDADGVRITREGREIRLPLRERAPAVPRAVPGAPVASVAKAPATAAVARAPATAADACKLAPEQRARAYILRPEIVDGVMREKSGWADLFKPAAEGLVVQNPGGTGAMLGLYGNDVLTRADGAQLSGPDDVLRLVMQPLARNESVVVTGARGGQPREWIYAGMNCLAR